MLYNIQFALVVRQSGSNFLILARRSPSFKTCKSGLGVRVPHRTVQEEMKGLRCGASIPIPVVEVGVSNRRQESPKNAT